MGEGAYRTEEVATSCPYCGESISVVVDLSAVDEATGNPVTGDSYIEDCEVCCRPIEFSAQIDGSGGLSLYARHENDC